VNDSYSIVKFQGHFSAGFKAACSKRRVAKEISPPESYQETVHASNYLKRIQTEKCDKQI